MKKKSFVILESPGGTIPVLEIDGVLYSESNAIARYIARKYGKLGEILHNYFFMFRKMPISVIGKIISFSFYGAFLAFLNVF